MIKNNKKNVNKIKFIEKNIYDILITIYKNF